MSSPDNPLIGLPVPQASAPPPPPLPGLRILEENPSWSLWEVIAMAVVMFLAFLYYAAVITFAASRWIYPGESLREVAENHLLLVIFAQMLAYVVLLVFMVVLVKIRRQPFWSAIRWNWPSYWGLYLLGGFGLSVLVGILQHVVPMPKETLPIEKFFNNPSDAWVLVVFGVSAGPLMEELFFRGFLYPALTRRVGMFVSVIITAIGFSLIHASQLGSAWGPVFVIFVVGIVLTLVRAKTKSVAAGFLVHIAYNGTLFIAMLLATGGFRHVEKLSQ